MTRYIRTSLLGLMVAGVAACTGSVGGDENSTNGGSGSVGGASGSAGTSAGNAGTSAGSAGTSSGSAGTSSGGSTAGASGGSTGSTDGTPTCVPGIPATTQIPRLLNREYDATVRDLLGLTTLTTAGGKKPSDLLYADFDGPMVPDAWRLYQDTATTIAHEVMTGANKAKFISCDPAASGCLTQTIKTFGRKAFRRPLTDDEVARFTKLSQTTPAGAPADVAETTLMAFLVSPSFIYLPELTTTMDPSGEGIQLSSYEVATRLSFLLWGSVPDDILNMAADNNQLQTADQILTQAKRMIAVQDKTSSLVSGFHRHWVQQDNGAAHWWKMDHDTTKFPLYSAAAKPSYQTELDDFFADVTLNGGTMKDLFLSNVGFVNQDNAAIYGLDPSKYGADFVKVQLDPNQRPGFMTRVGFLSSYAHYDETAPILRGAFITVSMLGVNPGTPDPANLMKTAPAGNYMTNREKTEALVNSEPTCKLCHAAIINPSGYVLEAYDAIGKWQTMDQLGGPIDGTATVTFDANNVKQVTSPLELMQGIAQTEKTKQIYAQYWVSYAYGRQPNANDQCVVDQLDGKLSQDGYSIVNLMADLTQADSFRMRVRAN